MNDFYVVVSEDVFNGFRQFGMKRVSVTVRDGCGWMSLLNFE